MKKNLKFCWILPLLIAVMVTGCPQKPERTNPLDPLSLDYTSANFVVSGCVTDRDSGTPLSGTRVELGGNGLTTLVSYTDAQGNYNFSDKNLYPGNYQLNASKIFYTFASQDISKGRSKATYDISLMPNFLFSENFDDGIYINGPGWWTGDPAPGDTIIVYSPGRGNSADCVKFEYTTSGSGSTLRTTFAQSTKKIRVSFWVEKSFVTVGSRFCMFMPRVGDYTYAVVGVGLEAFAAPAMRYIYKITDSSITPWTDTYIDAPTESGSPPIYQYVNMTVEMNYSGDGTQPGLYIYSGDVLLYSNSAFNYIEPVQSIYFVASGSMDFYLDDVVVQK